jgi:anti-anti-sigma factor
MSQLDYHAATNTYLRCFEGKLTSALCADLATAVAADVKTILAEHPDAKLVFDLAQVEYVVSAFLRMCLWSAKQLPKGRFAIINCRPEVKKIFSIARFDNIFDVF